MTLDKQIHSAWRGISRVVKITVIIVLALMVLRIALPYAVKWYVNRQLNESADYAGKIGDVSMRLWKGGYKIHGIQIFKKSGKIQSPLFSTGEAELSLDWRELFHGAVAGEVILHHPRVNIVEGPTPEQTQTGKEESWDKLLESLFPFKINRFEIDNGEVHFQNPQANPPVDIYTSAIYCVTTNLTNAREVNQKLPSGLHATARTIGGGELTLDLHMNLLKPQPAYEVNCGVTNLDMTAINSFLRAYGKFDVERGIFSLYVSVAADDGKYEGYAKVFFQNLNVFEWNKERGKNILEVFWDAIVGGTAMALKNHPKDQLATKVPISGSYTNKTSIGVWSATGTLLQNAFIQALVPKLDQHVSVNQVDQDKK